MRKYTINEAIVDDEELADKIKRFAELSDKIDEIKNNLNTLKTEYDDIEVHLRPILEQLSNTKDKALQVEKILVTIKRKGYERENVSYKDAFNWLYSRVNSQMKAIIDEALEKNKTLTKIASSIGVQKLSENKLRKSLTSAVGRITSLLKPFISFLSKKNQEIEKTISDFNSKFKMDLKLNENLTKTRKVTLNEFKSLVKRIIKEEKKKQIDEDLSANINQGVANLFTNILKKPVTANQINQIPTANKQNTQSANNAQTQNVANEDFGLSALGASVLGAALLIPTILSAAGQFINFLKTKFGLSKKKKIELQKLNKLIQDKKTYIQRLDTKDSPKEFEQLKKLENLYHIKDEEYGTLVGNSLKELGHSIHEMYIAPLNYGLTKISDTAVYYKMKQPPWLLNPQKRQHAANIIYSVLCLAFAGWQGYEHLKHLPGLTTTVVTVIKEGIEGGKSIKEIITSVLALI